MDQIALMLGYMVMGLILLPVGLFLGTMACVSISAIVVWVLDKAFKL